MKKLLLALAVCGFVFASMNIVGITNANATCYSGYGKIVYSYTYYGSTTPYGYFFVSNTSLPTYYYYYYTNNPTALAQLKSAEAAGETVYIYGSSSSCPTSGTQRYGGTVQYLLGYHNR